jgi:hypothetical protein
MKDIAERFHDLMAPIRPKEGALQSKFRIAFMPELRQNAHKLLDEVSTDPNWETLQLGPWGTD